MNLSMENINAEEPSGVFDDAIQKRDLSKIGVQVSEHLNKDYEKSLLILVHGMQVANGIINDGKVYLIFDSKLVSLFRQSKSNLIYLVVELANLITDELFIDELFIIINRNDDNQHQVDLIGSIKNALNGELITSLTYNDPVIKVLDGFKWFTIRCLL